MDYPSSLVLLDKSAAKQFTGLQELASIVNPDELANFLCPAGVEHYALLGYISTLFDNKLIVELGTRRGTSAVALSYNPANKVISYDIQLDVGNISRQNLEFRNKNIINTENITEALEAFFIFLDVDPHDGEKERVFIDLLAENNFRGILCMDDIGPEWPRLVEMWQALPNDWPKYDLTDVGHCTGTHIIDFSGKLIVI